MGFFDRLSTAVTSTSWEAFAAPVPVEWDSTGQDRADRYTGHGQPRQYPDPQRIQSRQTTDVRIVADEARPLTRKGLAARCGGRMLPTEPIGTAQSLSISAMYGAGQAGELGEIRWGMNDNNYERRNYQGELGPLQQMHGAQTVGQDMRQLGYGNRSTYRGGMMTGLPSTTGVAGLPLSDAQIAIMEAGL